MPIGMQYISPTLYVDHVPGIAFDYLFIPLLLLVLFALYIYKLLLGLSYHYCCFVNQVAVNTVIQDEKEFLNHIIKSTNMKCLTPV